MGVAPVISDARQVEDDDPRAGGKRRSAGCPAMREAPISEFGLMPAIAKHRVSAERDGVSVDLQTRHA